MQDSLIGYLLGALSDEESARFEAQLARDPQLREQLRQASLSLRPLREDSDEDMDPPWGLAQSTAVFVHESASQVARSLRFEQAAETDEWTLVDIVIAASVVLAACLLFFPAVNNSRYHAQIAGCQNNLRSIGQALIAFSSSNIQGCFPQVPERGNFAVAGMYAPTLIARRLVTEDHRFYCPASSDVVAERVARIPALAEIEQSVGQELAELQCRMGGDYGYTLGVQKHGRLQRVRNRSRGYFALMADAPEPLMGPAGPRPAHHNVLFESGCVRTLTNSYWYGDQLYRNDRGEVSAGLHDGDSVIGASGTAPLVHAAFK